MHLWFAVGLLPLGCLDADRLDVGEHHPSTGDVTQSLGDCGAGQISCTVENDVCYGTFTYCATPQQCSNAREISGNEARCQAGPVN
jgi:hypothetical protein